MRPPRPGSAWTSSRWARRGWYADYMNSPAWVNRKKRWFREHWARTHQSAACIVCGGRPVELHLYAAGGHGFALWPKGRPVDGWAERWWAWLADGGFVG